ncbi:MAG: DUF3098 domain-containing protein [Bacteroidota bacterium]
MQIPFKKINVYIILAGLAIIILGYAVMAGESFIDASAEEFSMALSLSPPLIIIGHVVVIVGVLFRKKDPLAQADPETVSKS